MKNIIMVNRYHVNILIISITIVSLSFMISIKNEEAVNIVGFQILNLHNLCLFKEVTGIPCPTCGFTRGFLSIGHLKIEEAAGYNISSIMFYLLVLAQIPFRLMIILKSKYLFIINKFERIAKLYFYLMILLMFGGWLVRFYW